MAQAPTKFEPIVNPESAKALGLADQAIPSIASMLRTIETRRGAISPVS